MKAFQATTSPGLDLERMTAIINGEPLLPFADLTKRTHGLANFAQHIVWQWRELQVPVIAAVDGFAFGGRFQLALGADMQASPQSRDRDRCCSAACGGNG
jgi:enoyl-CoA hydratase/carnithine racemase